LKEYFTDIWPAGSMIVVSVIFMILARQTHLNGKLRGKF